MEEIRMKLIGLSISRLYGHYNYENIAFNSDVTFIYGLNGCGKTTILNITEAIITGQIFKLFDYSFEKIVLKYAPQSNLSEINEIEILLNQNNEMIITFENQTYVIQNEIDGHETNHNKESYIKLNSPGSFKRVRIYFRKYPFLKKINEIFNYQYLPLNRSNRLNNSYKNIYYQSTSRRFDTIQGIDEPRNIDNAMTEIEDLIYFSSNDINSNISKLNDNFRNNILKSLLDINTQYGDSESEDILFEIISQGANQNDAKETITDYIELLKNLSLYKDEEVKRYENYFSELISTFSKDNDKISIKSLLSLNEIIRIKKIVSLAENTEKKKNTIRKPIELFINTINGFINTSEDQKEIDINPKGQVYFTTKYSKKPISIHYLSSGEKQLTIFFANLIFKLNNKTSGIFVVDEPELSLHLYWQKMFVDKTLEVNNNIQLIFATHAPEIIGKKRDKMFRLEKKYVD